MSLSASLAAHKRTTKGPVCTICTLVAGLSPEDATALQEALDDPGFTGAAIVRALRAEGHEVSPHALLRHRKRECRG